MSPAAALDAAVELLRRDRSAEARAILAKAVSEQAGGEPFCTVRRQLLEAYAWLREGKGEAGRELLQRAFSLAREAGLRTGLLDEAPGILAGLCAYALERGIEADFVHALIVLARLPPPSPAVVQWPYPIRIYTLGRASIALDGHPLQFAGKAPHRPLQLINYLVARGGRGVAVNRLQHVLWDGDDDRPAGRGAFDMALARLRRLLGREDALLLDRGLLSLNDRVCWVDIWALERLLGEADRQAAASTASRLFNSAMEVYQGDFLPAEEAGWAVLARERLRSRLLRSTRRLGQDLEQSGRWSEAAGLYERVREIHPLDEDLCRGLLRSRIEQGELAQASGAYRRCRALFGKVLGVLPSPATTALLFGSPAGQEQFGKSPRMPDDPSVSDPLDEWGYE